MPKPSGISSLSSFFRSKRIRLPLLLLVHTFLILHYTSTNVSLLTDIHDLLLPIAPSSSWTPATYLRLALSGPRPCHNAPCYILDVLLDPHRPRLFLTLLGLPASDIPRPIRGNVTRISLKDIRSNRSMTLVQSRSLLNDTHTIAVLLSPNASLYVLASCRPLPHGGRAGNAASESATYACDLPPLSPPAEIPLRVDVLLAPRNLAGEWGTGIDASSYLPLHGPHRPFYVGTAASSTGLFNSVTRRDPPSPSPAELRLSACLAGVDHPSPQQHREIVQSYLSLGFRHVYLGVPLWPTSPAFLRTWTHLRDFVREGRLTVIVSEYAAEPIEPRRFGKNFTYAPQGHKSGFVNTCLLAARAAGDDLAYVGDVDEVMEHRYGNHTGLGTAVWKELEKRNTTLDRWCGIALGSLGGMYRGDRAGPDVSGRIEEKLVGVGRVPDSVAAYGKTLANVRRVLRVGLHGVAYCEDGLGEGDGVALDGGNVLRPALEDIRVLHLMDSYRQRSARWMVEGANWSSYYVRDYSGVVRGELERRDLERGGAGIDGVRAP